jgi:hypothetical protein
MIKYMQSRSSDKIMLPDNSLSDNMMLSDNMFWWHHVIIFSFYLKLHTLARSGFWQLNVLSSINRNYGIGHLWRWLITRKRFVGKSNTNDIVSYWLLMNGGYAFLGGRGGGGGKIHEFRYQVWFGTWSESFSFYPALKET